MLEKKSFTFCQLAITSAAPTDSPATTAPIGLVTMASVKAFSPIITAGITRADNKVNTGKSVPCKIALKVSIPPPTNANA
ncbi:hypothetical protein TNCT_330451 [Trichonephila clavata]|uniref:Uncharacterized protein n=1 Tax=Trichonephila clavata TaxID=2740835 RepID=A0A8X6HJH1_TRICU|nr:hypothetical protein TNCT_330451 [Trichonephila clavata]